MLDATFWVAISFLLFIALLLYKKIPKIVLDQLDNKIAELKGKIDQLSKLMKNVRIGAKIKLNVFEFVGITASFNKSFNPSASG